MVENVGWVFDRVSRERQGGLQSDVWQGVASVGGFVTGYGDRLGWEKSVQGWQGRVRNGRVMGDRGRRDMRCDRVTWDERCRVSSRVVAGVGEKVQN